MNEHTPSESAALLRVIKNALDAASHVLLRDLGELERLQMGERSAFDFARRSQQRVASQLQEALLSGRPKYGYRDNLGNMVNGLTEQYFIVCPLVGFINLFAHALPGFAMAVALLERVGEDYTVSHAVIYQPLTDDFFVAEPKGAFHNQKWLKSEKSNYRHTPMLGYSDLPVALRVAPMVSAVFAGATAAPELPSHGHLIGVAAGLQLCYLAGGRLTAFWGDDMPLIESLAGLTIALKAGVQVGYRTQAMTGYETLSAGDTPNADWGAMLLPLLTDMLAAKKPSLSLCAAVNKSVYQRLLG